MSHGSIGPQSLFPYPPARRLLPPVSLNLITIRWTRVQTRHESPFPNYYPDFGLLIGTIFGRGCRVLGRGAGHPREPGRQLGRVAHVPGADEPARGRQELREHGPAAGQLRQPGLRAVAPLLAGGDAHRVGRRRRRARYRPALPL